MDETIRSLPSFPTLDRDRAAILAVLSITDELFRAREEIERWRHHYNTERPHSALGYRTPMEVLTTNAATALQPLGGSALPLIAQFRPEDSSSTRP